MNPEAQRIAIAEACGWRSCRHPINGRGLPPNATGGLDRHPIPDYLNDLNAMHEAEKLVDRDPDDYFYALAEVAGYKPKGYEDRNAHLYWCVMATAAQRAEAFLKTIGKWEGGES